MYESKTTYCNHLLWFIHILSFDFEYFFFLSFCHNIFTEMHKNCVAWVNYLPMSIILRCYNESTTSFITVSLLLLFPFSLVLPISFFFYFVSGKAMTALIFVWKTASVYSVSLHLVLKRKWKKGFIKVAWYINKKQILHQKRYKLACLANFNSNYLLNISLNGWLRLTSLKRVDWEKRRQIENLIRI